MALSESQRNARRFTLASTQSVISAAFGERCLYYHSRFFRLELAVSTLYVATSLSFTISFVLTRCFAQCNRRCMAKATCSMVCVCIFIGGGGVINATLCCRIGVVVTAANTNSSRSTPAVRVSGTSSVFVRLHRLMRQCVALRLADATDALGLHQPLSTRYDSELSLNTSEVF